MAGIIKVNQYQDFNGNTLFTSDGSGNLTTQNISYPAFSVAKSAQTTGQSDATYTLVTYDVELVDTDSAFSSNRFT